MMTASPPQPTIHTPTHSHYFTTSPFHYPLHPHHPNPQSSNHFAITEDHPNYRTELPLSSRIYHVRACRSSEEDVLRFPRGYIPFKENEELYILAMKKERLEEQRIQVRENRERRNSELMEESQSDNENRKIQKLREKIFSIIESLNFIKHSKNNDNNDNNDHCTITPQLSPSTSTPSSPSKSLTSNSLTRCNTPITSSSNQSSIFSPDKKSPLPSSPAFPTPPQSPSSSTHTRSLDSSQTDLLSSATLNQFVLDSAIHWLVQVPSTKSNKSKKKELNVKFSLIRKLSRLWNRMVGWFKVKGQEKDR
ncbi:hypothetical protein BKA69DRAFT_1055881 [Paraphysoderma sedebokerense]|nr:hypothetical protein BKA69DRAFT_1055881 [Paraphysoderma sedebokerense]